MSKLLGCIQFALDAHYQQTDRAGAPYILHPLRVMAMVPPEAQPVAVLHDVIEDTPFGFSDLPSSLSQAEIEALDALTRRKESESYHDYIRRAAANPIARVVKIADLRDNMSRLHQLSDSEQTIFGVRYRGAYEHLTGEPIATDERLANAERLSKVAQGVWYAKSIDNDYYAVDVADLELLLRLAGVEPYRG